MSTKTKRLTESAMLLAAAIILELVSKMFIPEQPFGGQLTFAAMLPMSTALEKTGVSTMIAEFIVDSFGTSSPRVALAAVYFATSIMTIFISNTVTAVLMAPIALQCAVGIGVSPIPFLFAVTVAASMCFASPFSTPPNALVLPAGQYTFMDFVKVGLPLQVLMGIVMVFALPLLFAF